MWTFLIIYLILAKYLEVDKLGIMCINFHNNVNYSNL
jgi:hypothetical protein